MGPTVGGFRPVAAASPRPLPTARGSWDTHVASRVAERDGPRLRALALRVLGDAGLAESVLEETLDSLAPGLPPDALTNGAVQEWLVASVHDRAVELARRVRGADPTQVRTRTLGENRPPAVTPEAAIGLRDALRYALATLPEEERSTVELVYFDGLREVEAAARLFLSVQEVRERCHAAMRHIASCVDLGGRDDPGGGASGRSSIAGA